MYQRDLTMPRNTSRDREISQSPRGISGLITQYHRETLSENTPLLAVTDEQCRNVVSMPYHHNGNDELGGSEIDANEFDLMLARASYRSGLGIEIESQIAPLLQGSRRRTTVMPFKHDDLTNMKRDPLANLTVEQVSDYEQCGEEEASNSPFLGGVSVGRFWLIFGGILANQFIACFDMTIMASSHPVITSYFHASNSASWLSTAFLLTSTAFQPLFGRLSDIIGRKPPFILTLSLFTFSTIWCALAQTMNSFIAARAFCGLGAGGMLSLGNIILSDLVPIEIRGEFQSYTNIVYGVGSALGAATGGAIADHLGWRWEFGVQVPFLCLCLTTACIVVPQDLGLNRKQKESFIDAMKAFDYTGSILLTCAVTFLILCLNLGGNVYPWTHPFVIGSLVLFIICTPLFLWTEYCATKPIMPLSIITNSPRANLIFGNFLAGVVLNAILFNVPIFFQAVLLQSATDSGIWLMVPSAGSTFSGFATGFIITWSKKLKWSVTLGSFLIAIGSICLCFLNAGMPTWMYLLFLVPASIGQGFQFPGTFMAVLAVSEQAEQAVVTSTLILWRSLGMVLGIAVSSLVMQNALIFYLNSMVIGPEKGQVIESVRERIQAIAELGSPYQAQVIGAYSASLKITFIGMAIVSLVGFLTVIPIKLPRLGRRIILVDME